ncbi:MAG: hypothetical protein AB7L92_08340 [Alphaproteobacteria bacterium]
MEAVDLTRFALSFLFVLGLIGLLAVVLRRYGNAQRMFAMKDSEKHRLQVMDVRYIDPKRRLLLVRRDNVEHLLLLSDGRELLIESGIPAKENDAA